jgi:hypothetical protein
MANKPVLRIKKQMEIPGSTNDLEIALDDLCDRLEDMDKLKDSIDPAKQRLTDVKFMSR